MGRSRFFVILCLTLVLIFLPVTTVKASSDTDEILDYTITVDVNQDATLTIIYDISWLVLESDSAGPLSWVKIGIPNNRYDSYGALSDNISSISMSSSGGSFAEVYFDDEYYEGETVHFQFYVVQDYMYQMNRDKEGYTVYSFTPGWFDDIRVDNLTIMWNNDKASVWSPDCLVENGYNVWNTSLSKGEKFKVEVTYPNDAFAFDVTKNVEEEDEEPLIVGILAVILCLVTGVVPILVIGIIIASVSKAMYSIAAGFGTETTKKVTRTKIEYYPVCQGCGGTRLEGQKFCSYCGRSFVKSEETVTEENVAANEKDILKYNKAGEFAYTGHPNTFIRVNVVNVPRPRTTSGSHRSSHRSSCAHSSCACACACACAGGGRAGCSTKDFYNTNLRLSRLGRK